MQSRTALSVDEKIMPLYSDIRELSSIKRMYQYNASVWDSWAKHIAKGGKVVGTSANSPIELLRAAGVFSIIYKRREDLNRAIIKSDINLTRWIYHFGVGECVCRYLNGSAGSPILGACPGYDLVITDFMPKLPDWNNMIASIGSDWEFQFLELESGLSRAERESAIYEKLLLLRERLEKLTGKRITDEMISESIRLTNEVTDVFARIDSFIKEEPHPLKSFDIYNLKVICTDYIGGITDELLGICYLLEDELRERVEQGVGYEGKKILLAGGFRNEFLHAIDSNGGIVTSAWPFQRFTAHRRRIEENGDVIGSLARWYAGHSGLGSSEENARDFVDLVRHYEVDAVIYNKQCPFGTRAVYDFHDAIKEAVHVPFLSIEASEEDPAKPISEFLRNL
ncbi:MAG: 2-hydroxyacyl-CoA dehydratase [Methanobacteriota archaeon]|nr:MAG: 2-hydroxyacyl-CoA dehydratase [Euryarchaeota archaeon]